MKGSSVSSFFFLYNNEQKIKLTNITFFRVFLKAQFQNFQPGGMCITCMYSNKITLKGIVKNNTRKNKYFSNDNDFVKIMFNFSIFVACL